eukprot:TRINITY_DN812_c0_g1_i1.p2 TRINITY_DN812_c0_g1~~TRINITY_DN812_c0_g1_i1.p2  ORF type:complete len:212 (-),score=58.00 TRINITY_DN812_c0_g1_i1:170-805(-)
MSAGLSALLPPLAVLTVLSATRLLLASLRRGGGMGGRGGAGSNAADGAAGGRSSTPSLAQRLAYARTAARLMRVDREFTPADYEALLELDAFGGAVPRGATKEVVDRLPVKVVGDEEEGSSSASTAGGSSSRADASRPTAGRDDRRRPAATGARRGSVYGLPRGDEPRPASYGARLWPRHATGDVAPVVGRSRRVAPCAKGCVGDSGLKVE